MTKALRAKILWTLLCLALAAIQAASARADDYCCVCFSETGCVNRGCDSLCGVVANEDECDAFCGGTEECRDGICQQYRAPCTQGAFCGSGQGLVCDDPQGVVQIPFCCDPTVPGSGCFRPGIATPAPVVPTATPGPTQTPVPPVGTPSSSNIGLALIMTLLVVIGLLVLVAPERH